MNFYFNIEMRIFEEPPSNFDISISAFPGVFSQRQGRRVPIRHSPQRAAQDKARRADSVHAQVMLGEKGITGQWLHACTRDNVVALISL